MRFESFGVEAPVSISIGSAQNVEELGSLAAQVSGTFVATMQLEGSLDGSTWNTIIADITTTGFHAIDPILKAVRINTTAYTSGSPVVIVAGHNVRTH